MDTYGIGIESSCDETGVSLIKNAAEIIKNPLFSQIEIHKKYGGVVPEKAGRAHLEKIPYLTKEITDFITEKKIKVSYIAVTMRPGLIGSLLVGYNTAMALGLFYKAPVIPIHHLEAHLYAAVLEGHQIKYPFIGLLLSGGNSAFYIVEGLSKIKKIGDTLDDACGEAYDKAAALLNLPYPGGPHIEKKAADFLASEGSSKERVDSMNPLPVILKDQPASKLDFSFSGIKTALLYYLQKNENMHSKEAMAYYFQERAIEIVARNLKRAIRNYQVLNVIAAGGVMANKTLKEKIKKVCEKEKAEFIAPSPALCTDNAGMVAALGYQYFISGSWPNENRVSSAADFF
ncbi:MAG: tRNA (adenosine(37)-N6)-threonylcarbamoyltransferase complex transferase subunit TsaD [Spirochaetia bacterium]|nr:tRNA (adenosine(37)-N6)-threonylcarbamoyltransferase complex transferase subunit TsaD [Spirochaetia bacterium]